ncbi:thiamine-phosphate kinase [candidate division WOR-1 bacterium RIFOXYB2_FULL_42_35]|uniref:Thiamine-monophosphate kinase n=1 Tax=candidate division WOR-1 bacterium RIFOXYC2_FULL_41_25 TaxID=1802586 RepID=A0A1F4TKJ7_UNCSA|nr:MAG: thiamine-phosphate kinase [candidate division WOR-1 bacterium RIFOXYA2_FULL_41_14]OGC22466.1 MAG: thiamine-phosphate kinase [candidate division WOR-1 bacterium RIFOXYB2_FULL_42_35]OGC33204.1 MAG: thiamine-phosphate kinase [candidate division WOR-1 bacterium RIFOXYC2_FULL_41_25]
MRVKDIGEFKLIERLAKIIGKPSKRVVLGIGDDCAVLQAQSSKLKAQNKSRDQRSKSQTLLLITTDTLIEAVHFRLNRQLSFFNLGQKALAVNISDIAAMGGWPTYALVTIGAHKNFSVEALEEIYRGIKSLAKKYKIDLVGGDTVRSPKELIISITLLGEVEKQNLLTRSGAKLGDSILVTGEFGGPAADKYKTQNSKLETNLKSEIPKLKTARKLAKAGLVTAMIDSSDGLARSVSEICKASKVGATIFFDQVPIAKRATLNQALYGGEEYELVFTAPARAVKQAQKIVKCTVVGQVVKKSQGINLPKEGFEHFAK